jgi:hypothetical protein
MVHVPRQEIEKLTSRTKDVAGWFSVYEAFASMYQWVKSETGDDRLRYLHVYLDEDVRISFAQLQEEERSDYEVVKSALLKRYGQKPMTAYREFVASRYRRGTALDGFVDELRRLLNNVVNIPSDARDALVLNQFLIAIPEDARERLQMMCDHDGVMVLREVLERARAMSLFNEPVQVPFAAPVAPVERSQPPSGVRCFNCNKIGHFSRDCPKPQKKKTKNSAAGAQSSH